MTHQHMKPCSLQKGTTEGADVWIYLQLPQYMTFIRAVRGFYSSATVADPCTLLILSYPRLPDTRFLPHSKCLRLQPTVIGTRHRMMPMLPAVPHPGCGRAMP